MLIIQRGMEKTNGNNRMEDKYEKDTVNYRNNNGDGYYNGGYYK